MKQSGSAIELANVATLDFAKGHGLLPAIVQDADTRAVLMLGYMNREALETTLASRRLVFFSRSRDRLWEKGEVSGNTLNLAEIRADCDGDALLVLARPIGPTCHNGSSSCFGDDPLTGRDALGILSDLEHVIAQRMQLRPKGSYTTSLFESGISRIAQKVGEEGLEVALAAVGGTQSELISELADLIYHMLVLLRARGLSLEQVVRELRARHVPDNASAQTSRASADTPSG